MEFPHSIEVRNLNHKIRNWLLANIDVSDYVILNGWTTLSTSIIKFKHLRDYTYYKLVWG